MCGSEPLDSGVEDLAWIWQGVVVHDDTGRPALEACDGDGRRRVGYRGRSGDWSQYPRAVALGRSQWVENVLALAEREARAFDAGCVGSEHVVLGLLGEQHGPAARVLVSLGLSVARVRAQLQALSPAATAAPPSAAVAIPLTPRARLIVLDRAEAEAQSLGHDLIDTEHILLGLARENEGLGMAILRGFGADAATIIAQATRMLPPAN
ncbi:MAG TPA: Clp protease N-terminal domain-containing protein [Solirubrobacteraceae bacterium]|jgi:hypothetical protein|nr:Clp protease N-terminal domain-containing protein [Solirubrobacteraceae bacterium]